MPESAQIKIGDDGTITVAAYCLKTVSWLDYCVFKDEAAKAAKQRDMPRASRCTRAALLFLFSHLEAVVNEILGEHPGIRRDGSLSQKVANITLEAQKDHHILEPSFRLEKHLRDIIAHPGITKSIQSQAGTIIVDMSNVFEDLSLKMLDTLERQLSDWLDPICKIFGVSRFTDTEKTAAYFSIGIAETGAMIVEKTDQPNVCKVRFG
jgi:hypothetical protein